MKKQLSLLFLVCCTQLILAQVNKESTAQNWLNSNVQDIQSNHRLDMLFSRSGKSGETFRYYHTVNGVEVFESSIAIHVSNNNEVTYTSSTFDKTVETIDTTPNISEDDALNAAIKALNIEGIISHQEVKLYVYNKFDETKLVYRVITVSEFLIGNWETIVDAKTNEVLSTIDIAIYENKKEVKKKIRAKNESVGFSVKSEGACNSAISTKGPLNVYRAPSKSISNRVTAVLAASNSGLFWSLLSEYGAP